MVSQRNILNMVLLRLQLYSEQNTSEVKVRSGLAGLNNPSVHTLLDYLFKVTQSVKKSTPVVALVSPPPLTPPVMVPDDEEEEEGEENYFETFFSAHVRESDDATNSVKLSHMYEVFTKWWNEHYEDEVSTKDELKEYLSEKLGQKIKSTVSNISLN
jgi:hypothetical protein